MNLSVEDWNGKPRVWLFGEMDFSPDVSFEEAYDYAKRAAENCGYRVEKLDNFTLRIYQTYEPIFYDLTWLDGKLFKIEKWRLVRQIFIQEEVRELFPNDSTK
jgi:hypothetical protein